jgi:hypothetical protein
METGLFKGIREMIFRNLTIQPIARLSAGMLGLALCLQFAQGRAFAQSDGDIAAARKTLEDAAAKFRSLIKDIDAAQWNFKSGPRAHSVGDEAEHVALSEQELQYVIGKAVTDPAKPDRAKVLGAKERTLRKLLLEGEQKAERYKPPRKLKTKSEVLEYFNTAHAKALTLLRTTPHLGAHVYTHPVKEYGDLTAYQWFYYIAYHNLKHCAQIEQMMAHQDFPKKGSTD